jgi:hypothetical protein
MAAARQKTKLKYCLVGDRQDEPGILGRNVRRIHKK